MEYGWWSLLCLTWTTLIFSVTCTDLKVREAELVGQLLDLYQHNATFARQYDKTFGAEAAGQPVKQTFPCPVLPPSPTVPTSVHSLRPGDIKVVAAIGDSLTAGRGASGGIIGLLIDYRGQAWSIGGDDDYTDMSTMPNILRMYNPDVYGYSQGVNNKKARFNVAVTGAKAGEALEQAKELVGRLQSDSNIDFENDWKLITVFLGANDLCDFCQDREKFSAKSYIENIQSALDYLHENVPRAFVNMVEVLNVEIAKDLANNLLCQAIHVFTCDCAANPKNKAMEEELIVLRQAYQEAVRLLVETGRYDSRDDFTVVLQPFYRKTFLPKTEAGDLDYSFFASDCFHYSKKGQQAAAEALWNNMVEPVGQKRLEWTPGEEIECPTEDTPYLFTSKNSRSKRHPHPRPRH